MGGDVKLSPVSVLHGDLTVEVSTTFVVSQPSSFAPRGTTEVVPETTVKAREGPARSIQLKEGASVEELIDGLHTMGATARDIVAIIQAIKAAGGRIKLHWRFCNVSSIPPTNSTTPQDLDSATSSQAIQTLRSANGAHRPK